MAITIRPSLFQFIRAFFANCKDALSAKEKSSEMTLAPLESHPEAKRAIAEHWAIDETNNLKQVQVVEVTVYPAARRASLTETALSYTREGEDPNLRITHYPPSNRLH